MMNTGKINQKEYLKKYLGGGKSNSIEKKKKKKHKKSMRNPTTNIVDDDIDLSQLANAAEHELDYTLGEDLPQIAGIIDERPADLIAKEDYDKSEKWKSIGSDLNEVTDKSKFCDVPKENKYSHDISNSSKRREISRTSRWKPALRRTNCSQDVSPPRRSKLIKDASPPRRLKLSTDTSSPRCSKYSTDASPARNSKSSLNASYSKYSNRSPDASPPRRLKRSIQKEYDSPPPTHKKIPKTLDGKKVGLQGANALREENEQFRTREVDIFRKMQEKQSNEDKAIIHDRKTGRYRNLHEKDSEDREKLKKEEERKRVYDRWSKGVKQMEDYRDQIASEVHEMSKPMARYANDEDLEDYLRNKYLDGDPMASYLQGKSIESKTDPCKPVYQGAFPGNRFNIRPGYRWDGVDRSNGYEKRWFNVLNQKKAVEEEAYKYSVEDM